MGKAAEGRAGSSLAVCVRGCSECAVAFNLTNTEKGKHIESRKSLVPAHACDGLSLLALVMASRPTGRDTDRTGGVHRALASSEGAGPLDTLERVPAATLERVTSLFDRIRHLGRCHVPCDALCKRVGG